MKWLRTLILFDQGNVLATTDWNDVHSSFVRAIQVIDFPVGSGSLLLRKKSRKPDGDWLRNGVGYLRAYFLQNMTTREGWHSEGIVDLAPGNIQPSILLYPSQMPHVEPITSEFGGFDFVTTATNGLRVAIEWETGNISSSHRSLNKLAIALKNGVIQAGVLIVPSRKLYEHLTDRIGNIGELSGYLSMWEGLKTSITVGLLAIVVVEHDELTEDPRHLYLKVGEDGRAKKSRKSGAKPPASKPLKRRK